VWVSIVSIPLTIFAFFKLLATNARFHRDARRISAVPLKAAPEAHVLYLRSFTDDEAASRLRGERTEEEHLTAVLSRIGPVVAIGRPGEYRPELGAGRMYTSDQEWQSMVEGQLHAARLVVVRTGSSSGLLWEIERAVRVVSPERLVIVVDNAKEMRECLAQIHKVHAHVRSSVWLGWRSIGSVRGVLVFDDRWQASRLKLRRSAFSKRQAGSVMEPRFSRTLRPVFERLHVPWSRPPRDWAKVVAALCFGGILAVPVVAGFVAGFLK
jgi:hypothetical protein